MTGIPSIVVGIFAYGLLVVNMGGFNAFAGAFSLAILMVPIITRTTEEIIRLVPGSIREAALALGAPRWKTIMYVVVPTALGGIMTGILLSVSSDSWGDRTAHTHYPRQQLLEHKGIPGPDCRPAASDI